MYIFIVVLIFLYFSNFKFEMFIPINSFDIPKDSSNILKDQVNKLKNIFISYNKILKSELSTMLSQFIETPYYIDKNDTDNLSELIKDQMIDKLNTLGIEGNLDLVRSIYNIKWKNDEKSNIKHFIFNVDLINSHDFYVIPLIMYITFDLQNKKPSSFQLLYIDIYDEKIDIFNISPYDYRNVSNYYRIKNHLYLFDPFLTSGKDMAI